MKPLIKYTGGKYSEYKLIKEFLPKKINNYYEPFFGGGGILFRLKEENLIQGKCYINDISKDLINFYISVSDKNFPEELYKISDAWDNIRNFGELFFTKFGNRFEELLKTKENVEFVTNEMMLDIREAVKKCSLNTHGFSLEDKIKKSLNDKLKKFQRKNLEEGENVTYGCITTSICQAFYFVIRDMYNDWNNNGNEEKYSFCEKSSQWMFIREFCYCSMFRFNSNGEFNIPYGGFSYNKKCFTCKIENILSKEVQEIFSNLNIEQCDFEDIITKWKYENDDFMFLDPPYDSTFTEYDGNSFSREEHIRLLKCLEQCNCNWMAVIGKTDFIENLYKNYNIIEYDKTYMYQARRTYNNKHTTHLVITNYSV